MWIDTNAVVVGHIQMGDDVLIAPGADVNFMFHPIALYIVLGNSGKIIKRENVTKEYIG